MTRTGPQQNIKERTPVPQVMMNNEPYKSRPLKPSGERRLRLLVEKLESRRLLAGINVSVLIDPSLSGDLTTDAAAPAANRIVYIDLNHDGQAQFDEPVAITDGLGRVFFEGLASGDYSIGLLTDNVNQRQITPATIRQANRFEVPIQSQWLIGEPSTSAPQWALTTDGILTLVRGNSQTSSGTNLSILELGGEPQSVVQRTPSEAWISYKTASQSRLAIFDTVTKNLTTYAVSNEASLIDLATDGQSVYGVLNGFDQTGIVKLNVNSFGLSVVQQFAGRYSQLEILNGRFVATRQDPTGTHVDLIDSTGTLLSSQIIASTTSQLKVDSLTSIISVVADGGVYVLHSNGQDLRRVAEIAEAMGPVAFASGRLLTSDRTNIGGVTLWNMSTWVPAGRFSVGTQPVRDFAIRPETLEAYVLSSDLTSLNLASAESANAKVQGNQTAQVQFNIQEITDGNILDIPSKVSLSVAENQSQTVDLRQQVIDAKGQLLWYSVLTGPQHGRVQLDPTGQLFYSPTNDYFGNDSLTIRVHDGQSSADVSINWNILELNRPPLSMVVQIGEVSESLVAGSVIGTVSVVDPNQNDNYKVTSSDYRFRVEDGKLILNESLDYEVAATVPLVLEAVDSVGQYSISTLTSIRVTNVVEAPEAVVLSNLSIAENLSNVTVGKLYVISPDADGVYEVTVDDPRFSVQGNDLVLLQSLNYEEANSIQLNLSLKDTKHPSVLVDTDLSLAVTDADDLPSAIILSATNVEEKTPGAEVGRVAVVDEDGDQYQVHVSDSRFVVTDGILRLTEQSTLDRSTELNISLTLTAITSKGGKIVSSYPLTVVKPKSPWQNPNNPIDVNNDGIITPRDALHVINFLNDNGPGETPPLPGSGGGEGGDPAFPDVNGDGRITPIDALLIINELNNRSNGNQGAGNNGGGNGGNRLGGEGESSSDNSSIVPSTSSGYTTWEVEQEQRRRNNSEIDAELERLLEQLASDTDRR